MNNYPDDKVAVFLGSLGVSLCTFPSVHKFPLRLFSERLLYAKFGVGAGEADQHLPWEASSPRGRWAR